jgi:hypothetical protein
MHSILFIASCLAASTVTAAPVFGNLYDFSDDVAEYLGRVSRHISRVEDIFDNSLSCDPSTIALPSFASGLPAPTDGQRPLYVALGRGTQVRKQTISPSQPSSPDPNPVQQTNSLKQDT